MATAVYEADANARRSLRSTIESSWKRAVEKGKLSSEAAARGAGRLEIREALEVPAGCALVLEAVPEQLELKRSLFTALDGLAGEETILGSNTSSLSIASLAQSTRHPDRVIGIHFFNPVAAMPLVEIVSGPDTSEQTQSRAMAFVLGLGKQVIRVKDSPGFATSRLGVALGLEAMRMVEEGIARASDIDKAMELGYGHRMGPLKTSDLVGLDVRLAIAQALARDLDPERFRPPDLLKKLVAAGRTGKKSGQGFYRWIGETPVDPTAEEESA
jgi:3-hydroxybutyryl-CoA dehydrogenase